MGIVSRRKRALLLIIVMVAGGIVLARYGGMLPSLADRTHSVALRDTRNSRLGRAIEDLAGEHAPSSGIHPLLDARDAFAARGASGRDGGPLAGCAVLHLA
jgi:cardiolipin synthase C